MSLHYVLKLTKVVIMLCIFYYNQKKKKKDWGATSIEWAEARVGSQWASARDADKHPTMNKPAPAAKNFPSWMSIRLKFRNLTFTKFCVVIQFFFIFIVLFHTQATFLISPDFSGQIKLKRSRRVRGNKEKKKEKSNHLNLKIEFRNSQFLRSVCL